MLRMAVTLQLATFFFVFVFAMTFGKFMSFQPLLVRARKRETKSKKKQETTLKLVLVLFF